MTPKMTTALKGALATCATTALLAASAAVANAVYHATGVRVATTPINPVQLCRLLAENRKEK